MKYGLGMLMLLALTTLCWGQNTSQQAVNPLVAALSEQETGELNDLAFFALSLSGTPYQYGGDSPDTGFDCSGFVRYVFRRSLDIELPRNTKEINRFGTRVEVSKLRPGDLVFYNTLRSKFSHVGIYLGDNQFVHSPSSGKSVRVEHMQDKYWRRRYNGARRITLP